MFSFIKKVSSVTARTIVASALIVLSVYLASLIYVLSFSLSPNIPEYADAVLVLGAKVNIDNTPSVELYNRSIEGIAMVQQGRAKYIMFTGGVGLGATSESEIGLKIAVQNGIPRDRILIEEQSHSTLQNISSIKPLAEQHNIKSVIVVSDQYHVARGVLVAKKLGFEPVYWSYPNSSYLKTQRLVWHYFREAAALLVYIPKLF
jgi:uncharacterized SAM-binding protein YcdF (DUF218 family)